VAQGSANAGRIGARILAALLSVTVLISTGVGWHLYRDLTGGLATSDVIAGGGLFGKPAGTDMNILLVGVDSRTDAQGRPLSRKVLSELRSGAEEGVLNSDTIIVLHVPANGGKATAISIPRDSYVDIPGYGKNKINSAYPAATIEAANKLRSRGKDALAVEKESRTAGRLQLIKTVESFTGVQIDHYAEVNLLGFFNLTNAIGGVQVCLKKRVHEFRSGADFRAGVQTISGGAALAFVRQRYGLPQSDFSRIRRQQVFLAAVAHKILSAGTLTNPARLSRLVDSAKEAVVLDSGWDPLSFARQASQLAAGNIQFITIPTTGQTSNEHGDVVTVDPDQVQQFVAEHLGGTPPPPRGENGTGDSIPPSTLTVDVRNGTGKSGLAGKVSSKLADLGYQRGDTGNFGSESEDDSEYGSSSSSSSSSVSTRSSSVHYGPGDEEAGKQVAKALGNMTATEDSSVPSSTVRVYLAKDFSLSDMRSSSGSSSSSSDSPPPPPAPPITAEGVPCVD
jgi:LCP family protein required for cell wall assembly